MSVFVWGHVDLKTEGKESSDKIILVSRKIQSPNGVGIRSISSSQTGTLVCCQDGSVQYCTHDSEHSATESILRNLGEILALCFIMKYILVAVLSCHVNIYLYHLQVSLLLVFVADASSQILFSLPHTFSNVEGLVSIISKTIP